MSPFIYESDDYDDEEVTEGGIEKGNYFEDTNFYYNPPSEGSESDVSEFWIDQGKSRKGSILSKRKEDQLGSKGAGMKKSSSFFIPTPQTHQTHPCLLYTSPSPRDRQKSRMPSSA